MKNYYKRIVLFLGLLMSLSTFGQIVANDDFINYQNTSGGITPPGVGNVTINDSLNGTFFTVNQATITLVSTTNTSISFNSEGGINIPNSTPVGTYTLVYQICEIANPTNCDTATVTIQVSNSLIANDDVTTYNGNGGDVGFTNVLVNDTLNGSFVNASQVIVTFISSTSPGVILSGANIIIAAGTPNGTYTLTYQICEIANPNNCDTAVVSITVGAVSTIIANDDNYQFYNLNDDPMYFSVLNNDTLNGVQTNLNLVQTTFVSASNPGIWLSPQATVFVNHQVPNGTYTLVYQLCELANPNNCDTATVTVTVNFCRAPTPIIDSIIQPTCENATGTVTISGLPQNSGWTLFLSTGTTTTTYEGSGQMFTLSGLTPGFYELSVSEPDILLGGCYSSFIVTFQIDQQLGISVVMNGSYSDYNNDGYTNVGDIINYSFEISNNGCGTITNISLNNNLLNIVGEPIPVLAGLTSDSTNFTASYIITQNDITNGFIVNSVAVFGTQNGSQIGNDTVSTIALNTTDGIKLNAFLDNNGNGVQDNSEQSFSSGTFQYQINSGATINLISSNGMVYLYETNPLNIYNLSYLLNNDSNSCLSQFTVTIPNYNNVTVGLASGITTYNFPIVAASCTDVGIYLYNYGIAPRPGFVYQNYIQYKNLGNQIISSGTITFTKDNLVSITSISESTATIIPTGFTYNFTNLSPNELRVIVVSMQVPTIPTVSLGQWLTNSAIISIPSVEINPNNNTSTLIQTIVGSFDPNDKTESHGGKIVHSTFTANDYLIYTIRFENTGTADAINVRVNDLLDAKLDETSIQMIRASHPYVLDRVGNNLNWNLNSINLPPSIPNDENTGHGYIVFQIKPKPGYAIGDIIPNSASIYFDFNPAIVTEPCLTEFVNALSTDTFALNDLHLYPNPVKNKVSISNSSIIDTVAITSVLGQEILRKSVNDLQTEIDLSSFANGIYFVKVSANEQEKIIKIVKE